MKNSMSRAERAKQFMPFSALDGLEDAIAAKAILRGERIILAEDAQIELDRKLQALSPGCGVSILYYCGSELRQLRGRLKNIDMINRLIITDKSETGIDDMVDIYEIPADF